MALNSSGPISLAGSTAGQSIAVELGQSATGTISLNDTAVRNLAGVPSGAIIMPTNFWGKSSVSYFIGTMVSNACQGVATDSSNNIYIGGYYTVTTQDSIFAKFDTAGTIQWQRSLYATGINNDERVKSMGVDSSGNVYIMGSASNSSYNSYMIAKYNSSGTLQWQKYLGNSPDQHSLEGGVVDSSGNIYVSGYFYSGWQGMVIAKYDTSGTLLWQRLLQTSGFQTQAAKIALDSSGNIYVTGRSSPTGYNRCIIVKYNNSGTIQWQRLFGDVGTVATIGYGIAADTSGNVYAVGTTNVLGNNDFFIVKYNTSGTLQWQKSLTNYNSTVFVGVSVDSSGNVYAIGYTNLSPYRCAIVKYDSSGSLQWQRIMTNSIGYAYGYNISVGSSNVLNIVGEMDGNFSMFAKLPGDGSKTGTYTVGSATITYAAASFVDPGSSQADNTSSVTDSAGTAANRALTLTSATTTQATSVTTI